VTELAKIQSLMSGYVLSGELSSGLEDECLAGVFSQAELLQIHRNNFVLSLTEILQQLFPVTEAFVGKAFVEAAIKDFVHTSPPQAPILYEYGGNFPAFISDLPQAAGVPYLGDVAKLEWAIHSLQNCEERVFHKSGFWFNGNVVIVRSDYPLLHLWMVGNGQLPPEAVHIEQGAQTVAAVLVDHEVRLQSLSADETNFIEQRGLRRGLLTDEFLNACRLKGLVFDRN
jgi:hypothetical protein